MKPLILSLVFSLVARSAVRADEPAGKATLTTIKVGAFDMDATTSRTWRKIGDQTGPSG